MFIITLRNVATQINLQVWRRLDGQDSLFLEATLHINGLKTIPVRWAQGIPENDYELLRKKFAHESPEDVNHFFTSLKGGEVKINIYF